MPVLPRNKVTSLGENYSYRITDLSSQLNPEFTISQHFPNCVPRTWVLQDNSQKRMLWRNWFKKHYLLLYFRYIGFFKVPDKLLFNSVLPKLQSVLWSTHWALTQNSLSENMFWKIPGNTCAWMLPLKELLSKQFTEHWQSLVKLPPPTQKVVPPYTQNYGTLEVYGMYNYLKTLRKLERD